MQWLVRRAMPRSRSRCRLLQILRHRVSFVVVSRAASALAAPYRAAARSPQPAARSPQPAARSPATGQHLLASAAFRRCAGQGWSGRESTLLDPKGTGQTRWITRWKPALNAFAITYADRMPAAEDR
jgi:hypothetical protein